MSHPVSSPLAALLAHCMAERRSPGSVLLQRGQALSSVLYIDSGRVLMGVAAAVGEPGELLEHQLGQMQGPGWLDATAAVLQLPASMDMVADTEVLVRSVPLAQFQAALAGTPGLGASVLNDIAMTHRRQTELSVSRLAKDAEARCAEWLLRHAEANGNGVCSVQLQQRKRLIAAQLGIAPETLSRVLRHLRERSLISGSGRTVHLMDPSGLQSLAGR